MTQVPTHYDYQMQPIELITKWNLNFCLGNVVKYLARAGKKEGESREKDLQKARDYAVYDLNNTTHYLLGDVDLEDFDKIEDWGLSPEHFEVMILIGDIANGSIGTKDLSTQLMEIIYKI